MLFAFLWASTSGYNTVSRQELENEGIIYDAKDR